MSMDGWVCACVNVCVCVRACVCSVGGVEDDLVLGAAEDYLRFSPRCFLIGNKMAQTCVCDTLL